MKRSLITILIFLTCITNGMQAQETVLTGIFAVDTTNTKIEFSAKHFGVLNVKGTFKRFSGMLELENAVLKSGSIELSVSSISTGNQSRDRSLKNEDFLDARSFPRIIIRINKSVNKSQAQLIGQIKGVESMIPLEYTVQRFDNGTTTLKAGCTISRKSFDLEFGAMDDLVSDLINVTAHVSLKRKKP